MSDITNKTARASSRFLIISILNKGLSIVFVIIVSRSVSKENFGILMLALSIAGISQMVGNMGLPVSIQKFLVAGSNDRNRYIGSVLLLGFCSAFIMSIILFFTARFITEEFYPNLGLIKPLKFITISVFFTILYTINRAILQSSLRIRLIAIYDLLRQLSKIFFVILLLQFSTDVYIIIFAIIISAFLAYIFSLFRIISDIGIRQISFNYQITKEIFKYSLPLVVVGFSYFLAQQTDRLMVGSILDAEAVAIYVVGANIAMFSSFFRAPFVSAFMPILTTVYACRDYSEIRKMFLFFIKWVNLFLGAFLLLIVGWGNEVIQIFGRAYVLNDTYFVLIILTFSAYFSNLFGPTGAYLQLTNGNKIEFVNSIIFILANILFNYFFILKFGVIGAAIATLIAGIIFKIIQVVEIYIREKIIMLSFGTFIGSVFIILVGGTIYFLDSEIARKCLSIISLMLFVTFNYFTMEKDEREFVNYLLFVKKRE